MIFMWLRPNDNPNNENPKKEFLTIKSYESQCDDSDKALNIETLFFYNLRSKNKVFFNNSRS